MRCGILVASFAAVLLLGGCGATSAHPSNVKNQSTSPAQSSAPTKTIRSTTPQSTGSAAPTKLATGSPSSLQALPGTLPGLTLTDADFVSAQDGWISGGVGGQIGGPPLSAGIVVRTTDGGGSWQVAHLPGLVPTQVLFLNGETGFAVAGHVGEPTAGKIPGPFGLPQVNLILRSGDGGRTWTTAFDASSNVTDLATTPGSIWAATSGTCRKVLGQDLLRIAGARFFVVHALGRPGRGAIGNGARTASVGSHRQRQRPDQHGGDLLKPRWRCALD